MSRLPNDCFSAPEEMIQTVEALILIKQSLKTVVGIENAFLQEAMGRILAEDITAPLSLPPQDNSAVDGYAFAFNDYKASAGIPFYVVGCSKAGTPFSGTLKTGQCLKILTGAVVPDGTDTIAMFEDCTEEDTGILLPAGLSLGTNVRKAGEDVQKGNIILEKGTKLRPTEIARIASLGYSQVRIYQPLTLGLFSTGDELVEPGNKLGLGQIFDSNRYLLRSLFQKFGVTVKDYGIIPDDLPTLKNALKTAAKECQMIVTSGGISIGDEDHVKQAVSKIGKLDFWRVAIKPGRPIALGTIQNAAFLGLPGNPVSALVCAIEFGFTIARCLMGQTQSHTPSRMIVPAHFTMEKKAGRREWLRGRYSFSKSQAGSVEAFHSTGSGLISSLTWANGLIEIPEDITNIEMGDPVHFIPFGELFE